MVAIPQKWIDDNFKMLNYVFSNKLVLGKKAFVNQEKFIQWMEENAENAGMMEADGSAIPRKKYLIFLSELEYYRVVTRTLNSGVTYISIGDSYWNLKKEINEKAKKQLPNTEHIVEETSLLTPLQHIYNKINRFGGTGKEFLVNLPKLVELAINIIHDPRTEWKYKSILSSALGFILYENNQEDEDYFDDLFLICFSLKHIGIEAPHLLAAHWKSNGDIQYVLNDGYQRSRFLLSDAECRNILHTTGISNLVRVNYPMDKKLALGLISYLMGQIYDTPDKVHTLKYAEDKLLSLGVYDDIKRILEISAGELIPADGIGLKDNVLTDEEYEILLGDEFR